MKKFLLAVLLVTGLQSFAQSASEKAVLQLSDEIFTWEVGNKTDSLNTVFHPKFIVIGADGNNQLKDQYISRLKSGSFVHDCIIVEEHYAIVSGNTAIVSGKGRFAVTVSGNKVKLHLSYMEVFTRDSDKNHWQVLAMKASVLDK